MQEASGLQLEGVPAVLPGYACYKVHDETYPAITANPKGVVQGLLYENIPADALQRLDKFEGDMFVRKNLIVSSYGIALPAWSYVIANNYREQLEPVEWNFDRFLCKGKRTFQRDYHGYRNIR